MISDVSFGSDLGIVGGFDGPSPSYSETEEDLYPMWASPNFQVGESQFSKSYATPPPENHVCSSGDRSRVKHHYSVSMDGCSTIKTEMLSSCQEDSSSIDGKQSMSAAKLAELAVVDPKRAKRCNMF